MINPLKASCLLKLGFLSLAVKCLLTNVLLFMELEEKNEKNQSQPGGLMSQSLGSSPAPQAYRAELPILPNALD